MVSTSRKPLHRRDAPWRRGGRPQPPWGLAAPEGSCRPADDNPPPIGGLRYDSTDALRRTLVPCVPPTISGVDRSGGGRGAPAVRVKAYGGVKRVWETTAKVRSMVDFLGCDVRAASRGAFIP